MELKSIPRTLTVSQVAAAAQVSVATASYALRNHPMVSAKTAARVQAVARRLGYRPNPRVASLMAHIRGAHAVPTGEAIAYVWLDTPSGERRYRALCAGARECAKRLGYSLEEFWLDEPGMTAARLSRILRARGITGVILSPLSGQTHFTMDWDWSLFSSVIVGNAPCQPELHHAGHYHYAAMRMAMLQLGGRKQSRIAGILDATVNERGKRGWSAAFVEHHPLPDQAHSFLALVDRVTKDTVSWLEKLQPETIVTTMAQLARLREIGFKRKTRPDAVLLDWQPNRENFGGVDQCEAVIAMNAVDMVAGQLRRNERGVPDHPQMLLFPGVWRADGREPE